MRILIKNHFENAWEALRTNKLRTFLTISGALIGTASITTVLSLAGGATNFFEKHIVSASETTALVRSSASLSATSLFSDAHTLPTSSTLTEKDAEDIGRIDNSIAAPIAILHTSFSAKDGVVGGNRATLIGSTTDLPVLADLEILEGQFLANNTSSSGIVMGKQLAIDVFGSERAIGNIITVRGQNFTVIGVLKEVDQPVNYLGVDIDRSAIITMSAMKQFTQGVAQIQQIVISSDSSESLTVVASEADSVLATNHLGEKDYIVMVGQDVAMANNTYINNITLVVAIVASVSLFVGGIGIMNIMLVNVAERNREVGIRKAIGASDAHIINQFLIESTIIGLVGGIAGYGIGVGIAYLVSYYLPFAPALDWQVAALSVGVSTAVGIIFGLYPAVRAARKDPIVALRQ